LVHISILLELFEFSLVEYTHAQSFDFVVELTMDASAVSTNEHTEYHHSVHGSFLAAVEALLVLV